MTNDRTHVNGDQRADFGMPISGRVREWSLRALPLAAAAVIADTKGDFSGFHAWSPPS